MNQPKRIGELNGKWAFLFKTFLTIFPFLILLLIWLVNSAWAANEHISRQSETTDQIEKILAAHNADMQFLRDEIKELNARINDMPSQVWRDKITCLEIDMKQNNADHADIKVSLAGIAAKLGVDKEPDQE